MNFNPLDNRLICSSVSCLSDRFLICCLRDSIAIWKRFLCFSLFLFPFSISNYGGFPFVSRFWEGKENTYIRFNFFIVCLSSQVYKKLVDLGQFSSPCMLDQPSRGTVIWDKFTSGLLFATRGANAWHQTLLFLFLLWFAFFFQCNLFFFIFDYVTWAYMNSTRAVARTGRHC